MSTLPVSSQKSVATLRHEMSFEEVMQTLSRDERFRATVYAMNTLLVQKGIYSPKEFEQQFCDFASKNLPAVQQP